MQKLTKETATQQEQMQYIYERTGYIVSRACEAKGRVEKRKKVC